MGREGGNVVIISISKIKQNPVELGVMIHTFSSIGIPAYPPDRHTHKLEIYIIFLCVCVDACHGGGSVCMWSPEKSQSSRQL